MKKLTKTGLSLLLTTALTFLGCKEDKDKAAADAIAAIAAEAAKEVACDYKAPPAIRLADEAELSKYASYHDAGISNEFKSDVIIANVAVKDFRIYDYSGGKLSDSYTEYDLTPEKPVARNRDLMLVTTVLSYIDGNNARCFFSVDFGDNGLFLVPLGQTTAAEPDYIPYDKLQEKGGVYSLEGKPFTGKAKQETMGEYSGTIEVWEMKDGKLHGEYSFASEDNSTEGTYKDGKKDGQWTIKEGEVKIIGNYVNGKKQGEWKYAHAWYNSDSPWKIETYENDKLIKTWEDKSDREEFQGDAEEDELYYILGNWKAAENCYISLEISKTEDGKGYSYSFAIDSGKEKYDTYKGKVTVNKNDKGALAGIVLEGIPWVSNQGDVSKSGTSPSKEIPAYGIDFLWDDNKFVMQNYGNAESYYVKLSCDEKYITMEKE